MEHKTNPFFLRTMDTPGIGLLHFNVTLLPAGTTELGQALRLGLGRGPGKKQRSGLDLTLTCSQETHLGKGEGKETCGV
jgi:hypothetical protein